MRTNVAFDTETLPICDDHVIPPIVCLSYALRVEGEIRTGLSVVAEREQLLETATELLSNKDYQLVGHNAAYDMAVLGKEFPELWPLIFAAYAEGRVSCTKIGEKEWRVSTTGDLEWDRMPDGTNLPLKFNLNVLEKRYLGIDRSFDKGIDAWRMHYGMLRERVQADWPDEAIKYAMDDASGTLQVREKQLEQITESGPGSTNSHDIDVAADFGLLLMTDRGMATDAEHWHRMKAWLEDELSPENMEALLGAGILKPAVPPKLKGKPKVTWTEPQHPTTWEEIITNVEIETGVPAPRTGKGDKVSLSKQSREAYWQQLNENQWRSVSTDPDVARVGWTVYFKDLRTSEHSGAMTKGKPESIAEKKLRELVGQLAEAHGIEIKKTDGGEPSLSADAVEPLAGYSPVIEQYVKRKKVAKLVTTELPRMCYRDENGDPIVGNVADVVHFNFDTVKETYRTSSFAGDLYASANGQNVDPRAREMYVAREGMVLCSVDYSALELVSLANKLEQLFGTSVLGGLIRSGVDPHAYLGAQLAFTLDKEFQTRANAEGVQSPKDIYELFMRAKTHDSEDVRAWFKHYRTFAKPTGLGYPGGLGPKTFVTFAWTNYGIRVDLPTATMLREVWLNTFPEMRMYFDWIKVHCKDPRNDTLGFRKEDDSPIQGFCYEGPGGVFRAGCPYTACCNGAALQTPSAIGAKLAVFDVQRACYDPSQNSVLYGTSFGVNFVHDEIIVEMPHDNLVHERAAEISRLMEAAMLVALPLIPVGTEAAVMHRWNKYAEAVHDTDGRLTVWSPS